MSWGPVRGASSSSAIWDQIELAKEIRLHKNAQIQKVEKKEPEKKQIILVSPTSSSSFYPPSVILKMIESSSLYAWSLLAMAMTTVHIYCTTVWRPSAVHSMNAFYTYFSL